MSKTGRAGGPGSEELVLSPGDSGVVSVASCVSADAGRVASAGAPRVGAGGHVLPLLGRETQQESRLAGSPSHPGGSVAETPADRWSRLSESLLGRFLTHRLVRRPRRPEPGPWRPTALAVPGRAHGWGAARTQVCPGFRVCFRSDPMTNR